MLIIFDQEDSLFMSYGLISDTLYFGGDFIFCDFDIAAITPDTLDASEMNYFRSQNILVEENNRPEKMIETK